jgi:hypothetical protein
MKQAGLGYAEIIAERLNDGFTKSTLESKDHPEWSIYIGRMHVTDHETGITSRGLLKIGRAKYVNTIQRGRNQGGADFRIYARLIVKNNKTTSHIEKLIKQLYANRRASGPQNQTELYNIPDAEIKDLVNAIVDNVDKSVIKAVRTYI